MLLESRLKVSDIKPDQGHLDIDKIEHFIDLRNTPVYFFLQKSIIRQKKPADIHDIDRRNDI